MLCFLLEERMGDVAVRLGRSLKSSDKSLLVLTHTSMVDVLWEKVQRGFVKPLPAPKEKEESVRCELVLSVETLGCAGSRATHGLGLCWLLLWL